MRLLKNIVIWIGVAAAGSALAADPVPTANPEKLPELPAAPAKASAPNAGKVLQLDEPVPAPTAPPSLLPDDIPVARKIPSRPNRTTSEKPGAVPNPREAGAELELRIRYRKARNVAETNDKVRAAWEDSRQVKTEYAKRQSLKRYYELLFARMLSVDRGLASFIEKQRKAEFAVLTQTQIAPTVPNE